MGLPNRLSLCWELSGGGEEYLGELVDKLCTCWCDNNPGCCIMTFSTIFFINKKKG
jgi:hypothetical protein